MQQINDLLKQVEGMLNEQDKLFHQEIVKIKDNEKRQKVVTLYNEMKASKEPMKYLPEITSLLNGG